MSNSQQPAAPLIFGEVLFDCFEPNGPEVLGGAPFNVAWHLHGFGAAPLMVSAIGADSHGEQVLERMRSWGMDLNGIQQRSGYQTGRVKITMDEKNHTFDILPDQAYDHIAQQSVMQLIGDQPPVLLYCGSLAGRMPQSAETLQALINTQVPLFVDINLRAPWWQKDAVWQLMGHANWLKLNDEEFVELIGGNPTNQGIIELKKKLKNEWLILTHGEQGASITIDQTQYEGKPPRVESLVDTVGAGDAFSSVVILGIINHWQPDIILERALEFAASICQQRGATALNNTLYENYRNTWQV